MVAMPESKMNASCDGEIVSPLKVKNGKLIRLTNIMTSDGCILSIGESQAHIPFEIKRFYYIYNFMNQGMIRGGHAHKSFEQVFFCLMGSLVFHLDDGTIQQDVEVNSPDRGVYVGPELWHDMIRIAKGSIIFVVASHAYSETDYIRDYQQFLAYIKK